MQRKAMLLMFVSVLLLGSLAAFAAESTGPASATAAKLPFCVADLAAPKLPEWNPSPSPRTGIPCGACSSGTCGGVAPGTFCSLGSGRGQGHCNPYTEEVCGDGTWNCSCSSSPLN
jgi:hypothetical protein